MYTETHPFLSDRDAMRQSKFEKRDIGDSVGPARYRVPNSAVRAGGGLLCSVSPSSLLFLSPVSLSCLSVLSLLCLSLCVSFFVSSLSLSLYHVLLCQHLYHLTLLSPLLSLSFLPLHYGTPLLSSLTHNQRTPPTPLLSQGSGRQRHTMLRQHARPEGRNEQHPCDPLRPLEY